MTTKSEIPSPEDSHEGASAAAAATTAATVMYVKTHPTLLTLLPTPLRKGRVPLTLGNLRAIIQTYNDVAERSDTAIPPPDESAIQILADAIKASAKAEHKPSSPTKTRRTDLPSQAVIGITTGITGLAIGIALPSASAKFLPTLLFLASLAAVSFFVPLLAATLRRTLYLRRFRHWYDAPFKGKSQDFHEKVLAELSHTLSK